MYQDLHMCIPYAIDHCRCCHSAAQPASALGNRQLLSEFSHACKTAQAGHMCMQVRLIVSAFNFRMNRRLMEAGTPTFQLEIDHSASAREGCTVSTLGITAEPKDWRSALEAGPPT